MSGGINVSEIHAEVWNNRNTNGTDRRSLSDQVADLLMEKIILGNLRPGDRLPTEPELIEEYGVSRTVIREAGRMLVARGIVSIQPRIGMTVAEFDQENLARQIGLMLRMGGGTFAQLMEMRETLEPGMVAIAAERRTEDDVKQLELLVELIDPEKPSSDHSSIDADVQFHALIAHMTGNPFFEHLVYPINAMLSAIYRNSPGYAAEHAKTHVEHRLIADAIANKDAEKARALMTQHLERVTDATGTLLNDDFGEVNTR